MDWQLSKSLKSICEITIWKETEGCFNSRLRNLFYFIFTQSLKLFKTKIRNIN